MDYQRVKCIENVQIPVRSLEDSIQWYEENLGFKLKGRGNSRLAFLQLNENDHINLWQTDDDTTINFTKDGEQMPAFVMVSENIELLHEDLKSRNIDIVSFTDEGFAKIVKFFDPNGNVLLVLEYK